MIPGNPKTNEEKRESAYDVARRVRKLGSFASPAAESVESVPENGGSRPSLNKCARRSECGETAESAEPEERRAIPDRRVAEFLERRPDRAKRPLSVEPERKLREECVWSDLDKNDDEFFKSKSWKVSMREFLKWHVDYDDAGIKFRNSNGETFTSDMLNSYHSSYANRYYAKLMALQRMLCGYYECNECDNHYCSENGRCESAEWVEGEYQNPHTVMLTLSGTNKNGKGKYRCPVDHIRDILDSGWNGPVRRKLYRIMGNLVGKTNWEYATVLEPHKSGYGHVHIALFVDGAVKESDFHPFIRKYLEHCDIAGYWAHNVNHLDPVKRPVSVRKVGRVRENGTLQNLASYVSEYIGAFGTGLLYRPLNEVMFYTAMWASNTRRVRFSQGANQVIKADTDDYTLRRCESEDDPCWRPFCDGACGHFVADEVFESDPDELRVVTPDGGDAESGCSAGEYDLTEVVDSDADPLSGSGAGMTYEYVCECCGRIEYVKDGDVAPKGGMKRVGRNWLRLECDCSGYVQKEMHRLQTETENNVGWSVEAIIRESPDGEIQEFSPSGTGSVNMVKIRGAKHLDPVPVVS